MQEDREAARKIAQKWQPERGAWVATPLEAEIIAALTDARAQEREAIAKWHDDEAAELRNNATAWREGDATYADYSSRAYWHEKYARAIRSRNQDTSNGGNR